MGDVMNSGRKFRSEAFGIAIDRWITCSRLRIVGYVSESLYRTFYVDSVANIAAWFDRRDKDGARRTASVEGK